MNVAISRSKPNTFGPLDEVLFFFNVFIYFFSSACKAADKKGGKEDGMGWGRDGRRRRQKERGSK